MRPPASRVDYGTNPGYADLTATVAGLSTSHAVQLVGLAASTTYYFRVTSADVSSNSATSPAPPNAPASFTTQPPPSLNCPCSIWTPAQVPGTPSNNDQSAVELGLKFRSTFDGFITGIRFYKSAQNTGTHTGSLWTTTGTLLRSVTFTNESASGWQQALFASPVPVTANTTLDGLVPHRHRFLRRRRRYFQSSGVTNGPLQALAMASVVRMVCMSYGPAPFRRIRSTAPTTGLMSSSTRRPTPIPLRPPSSRQRRRLARRRGHHWQRDGYVQRERQFIDRHRLDGDLEGFRQHARPGDRQLRVSHANRYACNHRGA